MSGTTADPYGAQAHARAMAGTRVEAMPTIPASDAQDIPAGVTRADLVWTETVAAGGYASRRIARGSRIRLTDIYGDACASVLMFNAECPVERLNVADTVKVQWNAYLGAGKLLLSDMGRVMASIVEDAAQKTHDCFCGASTPVAHLRKYGASGNYGPYPSARERFLIALAKYGLGRKDVHPCINLFKGVTIGADGATRLNAGPFAPDRSVILRVEMDLILVIANCPHVLDTRPYSVTPLRASAWRGPVTAEDDSIRNATPEGLRAFLNTEDYYRR